MHYTIRVENISWLPALFFAHLYVIIQISVEHAFHFPLHVVVYFFYPFGKTSLFAHPIYT